MRISMKPDPGLHLEALVHFFEQEHDWIPPNTNLNLRISSKEIRRQLGTAAAGYTQRNTPDFPTFICNYFVLVKR